jgi:hypothetical protein
MSHILRQDLQTNIFFLKKKNIVKAGSLFIVSQYIFFDVRLFHLKEKMHLCYLLVYDMSVLLSNFFLFLLNDEGKGFKGNLTLDLKKTRPIARMLLNWDNFQT